MELLKEERFRKTINGESVQLFTLRNKNHCVAQFTNYGARWLSMWVQDRNDQWADVVLGFESLEEYLDAKEKYYGAIVGRVSGRIGKGAFELEGIKYQLATNDIFGNPVKNHLHGGAEGFSFQVWKGGVSVNDQGEASLTLTLFSKDGEEGFPGNLRVKVIYTLGNDNSLKIHYSATTDKVTIINLTNHAYFNLHGDMSKKVLDHAICIRSESSVECDDELIPTGAVIPVKNTPAGKGYLVYYVLDKPGNALALAATVEEKKSGRVMEVYTDQPGIQLYNASLFDGTDVGKRGQRYFSGSGLALEAQGFPDAINHPQFPSVVLFPGEEYRQTTIYRFLTK